MKILVADDDEEQLYLLEKMLRGSGYEVHSVHSGLEACEKLEAEKFDLIISDILMPRMDGFELCRYVKERDAFKNIPFIFYTATYTDHKDEELGLGLGASRFILKPAEPERFLAIVRSVIEEYQTGHLAPALPKAGEGVLLKAYNERLVRKLEQKVKQLEEITQRLEREALERNKAQAEVRKLNLELEKRVRERTCELAAANKELEIFAAAVSHDLRAPLRGIEGFSQILARACAGKLDDRSAGYLERVISETHRMEAIIAALLQLSRTTRAGIQRQTVNLSRMAREVEVELRQTAPERTADFSIASGMVAQGDPVLLRCVLQNLLGNAWKFTAKTPQPKIEFGVVDRNAHPAYFVRDNGAGFDMAAATKLFAPFQRLHDAHEFPGTGVGLATVRQIIRRHGGDVSAESAPGKGATFYFSLS